MEVQARNRTGDLNTPLLNADKAQAVVELHGKYYELAKNGQLFVQTSTPLGLAVPIYTGTALAGAMPIWNPLGSGVNVVPISYSAALGSGTSTTGAIGLMARNGVGNVIGTGQQITAFAETVPVNTGLGLVNSIGGSGVSRTTKVRSSNAGTVTVSAGVAAEFIQTLLSMNQEASATATTHGLLPATFEFDGKYVVPPGSMIWFAATVASGALIAQSIMWAEVPL